jgi:hypothetical protein
MLTNGQETHLEIYYWVAVPLLLTNVLKGIIELVLGISPRLGLNFDTMFRLSIFEPEWKKYLLRFAVDPVAVRRIGKIRLALVFITAIIGLLLIL